MYGTVKSLRCLAPLDMTEMNCVSSIAMKKFHKQFVYHRQNKKEAR